MIALSCTDLSKAFSADPIFENVSFSIEAGDRVGLIGANGAGKTTLMDILTGRSAPDTGSIYRSKTLTVGYLEQSRPASGTKDIYSTCAEVFEDVYAIEHSMRALEREMAGDQSPALMMRYTDLTHEFERLNGYAIDSKIRGVLTGMGFSEAEYGTPAHTLSGGEHARLALARLLLTEPDILFLDEPTNHLDIGALQWIESFLRDYSGTVVFISHDRYFLDSVATRILELEDGQLYSYSGNYSHYRREKADRLAADLKAYTAQQAEVKRQEQLIQSYKGRGTEKLAKRARSREKRLAHMTLMAAPKQFSAHFNMKFETAVTSGKEILSVRGLSKGYDETPLFSNVTFDIYRSERIGLIGPNGVGKTTLFKILLDQILADTGTIQWGHRVVPGYYAQNLDTLNPTDTVLEAIHTPYSHLTLTEVRTLLGAFLFSGDEVEKTVSVLSGGERGRLSLLKLMLSQSNFLMLDEPTNHLDLNAKETLETALLTYAGTLLIISHDRYFLNKVCTRILELSPEGITAFLGNYDAYMEKKQQNAQRGAHDSPDAGAEGDITKTQQKKDLRRERALQKETRALKKELAELESEISSDEERLHELEQALYLPELYTDVEAFETVRVEMEQVKSRLAQTYEKLDELLEKL